MKVVYEVGSKSYQRSEVRADRHYEAIVWYAIEQLGSQKKGSFESFEIGYPCWIRLHGVINSVPIVQFIQAANEVALLGDKPFPNAEPVLPGVSWLLFDEPDSVPTPSPAPPPVPGPVPTPGPAPLPIPLPDQVELPKTTTWVDDPVVARPEFTLWTTKNTPGYELVVRLPTSEYWRFYQESGFLTMLVRLAEMWDLEDLVVHRRERQ